MSPAAHHLVQRMARSDAGRATPPLRLPEDRAFDISTINGRLARMAEQAALRAASPALEV